MDFADALSIKVDDSEQAAAADVEMKESDNAGDQPSAANTAKPGSDNKQTEPTTDTEPAKDAKAAKASSAPVDNIKGSKEAEKQPEDKKEVKEKEKETIVDEDLLHAFRYFDKTGKQLIVSGQACVSAVVGPACMGAVTKAGCVRLSLAMPSCCALSVHRLCRSRVCSVTA